MTRSAGAVVAVFGAASILAGPAFAQVRYVDDIGQAEYQSKCAACHGADAKGKGPVADQLKSKPADLTQLARRNGGVFPFKDVTEKIDGRQEVKAHGPTDMPVWGYVFALSTPSGPQHTELWPCAPLPNKEVAIRTRLLTLVDYLHRMQDK
jgi:mono/diheme cytochrome c family protein